mmetsp:Transcript_17355/g.65689  ORF Transcript_17355/g.65689 Transcript_17355/m.65689 type:complete len:260 (-) Transcript_17355:1449-2228(-)
MAIAIAKAMTAKRLAITTARMRVTWGSPLDRAVSTTSLVTRVAEAMALVTEPPPLPPLTVRVSSWWRASSVPWITRNVSSVVARAVTSVSVSWLSWSRSMPTAPGDASGPSLAACSELNVFPSRSRAEWTSGLGCTDRLREMPRATAAWLKPALPARTEVSSVRPACLGAVRDDVLPGDRWPLAGARLDATELPEMEDRRPAAPLARSGEDPPPRAAVESFAAVAPPPLWRTLGGSQVTSQSVVAASACLGRLPARTEA